MSTKRLYNYEIMFLIGQNQTGDLNAIIDHIKDIVVTRGHGEILAMKKWDERRLAYEISGQKRGLYILCYARCPGSDMSHIERDCNLSEKILRTLIIRCDHLSTEDIKALDATADLHAEAKLRADRSKEAPAAEVAEPAAAAE